MRVNQIAQRYLVHAAVGVWAVTTRVEVPPLLRREVRVRLRLQRLAHHRHRDHQAVMLAGVVAGIVFPRPQLKLR